jgi:hypothetical protein
MRRRERRMRKLARLRFKRNAIALDWPETGDDIESNASCLATLPCIRPFIDPLIFMKYVTDNPVPLIGFNERGRGSRDNPKAREEADVDGR